MVRHIKQKLISKEPTSHADIVKLCVRFLCCNTRPTPHVSIWKKRYSSISFHCSFYTRCMQLGCNENWATYLSFKHNRAAPIHQKWNCYVKGNGHHNNWEDHVIFSFGWRLKTYDKLFHAIQDTLICAWACSWPWLIKLGIASCCWHWSTLIFTVVFAFSPQHDPTECAVVIE